MTPSLQYSPPSRRPTKTSAPTVRSYSRLQRGLNSYRTGLLVINLSALAGVALHILLHKGTSSAGTFLSILQLLSGLATAVLVIAGMVFALAGLIKASAALNGTALNRLAFPAAYCSLIAALLLVPASAATIVLGPTMLSNLLLGLGALFGFVGHSLFLMLLRKLARALPDESLGRTVTAYLGVWVFWCSLTALFSWAGSSSGGSSTLMTVVEVLLLAVAVFLSLLLVGLVGKVRDLVQVMTMHGGPLLNGIR
jgi:hypothetical protein